ncbi:WD40 repeat-like protein [Westerdykella ornata]|uniref:WD40 repeat-like protein n=1 Tax=Westerdykella ornata TaxID=318751 RepID=A0A6A6JZZ0_WESOR|nr:WD40 repeat-like protein [Westerdykella ornata]KAF2281438.1 WD40 repeat-like protein [Westerdykella ornata]
MPGYGNAALQLSRCWNREPDALPFARNVAHHTLIRILQDGLEFDRLQAEVQKTQPRYNFGADHGRPFSVRNGDLLTLDEGIPAYQLAEDANDSIPDAPPKKGAKKKKAAKVNGVVPPVDVQTNGDAMDLDHPGHTNVTNSVRAESEMVPSDAESPSVADLPISTLSIGQSTEIQTEVPKDLVPNTTFACSVKESDKQVTLTTWGTPAAPYLLAAGNSILRAYLLRGSLDMPPMKLDYNLPLGKFSITAACFDSKGLLTVSARQESRDETGEILKTDRLFRVGDEPEDCYLLSSTAGLVTALRWNEQRQLLLAISSDGQRGSIKIWRAREEVAEGQPPDWTAFTDKNIFAAVWVSDSSFVVCGEGIFAIYDVTDALTCRRNLETSINWDVVKADPDSGIIVALGVEDRKSFLGIVLPSGSGALQTQEYPDEYFEDLDIQTRARLGSVNGFSSPDEGVAASPVLLATCATSGVVRIWDARQPFRFLNGLSTADFTMARSIAFSPNGRLLAAAGPYSVTVWDLEKGGEPVATWRTEKVSRQDWDPSVDGEFSLGWHPNSSKLSIALGNQVAVMDVEM